MFNTIWQGFLKCHVAFVRKKLLDVEFAFCEGLEVPGSAKNPTGRTSHNRVFYVLTRVSLSQQGFPGRKRAFFGFVSRQEFLCRDIVLRF